MKNKSPSFNAVMGKIKPVKALNPELKAGAYLGKNGKWYCLQHLKVEREHDGATPQHHGRGR
jgi:hypothetical protein